MSEDRFENRNEDNNRVNRQQSHKEERLNRTSHDPIRGLLPALILILLGVLFFLTIRGNLSWGTWWQYFLVGLGVIFLIDATIRVTHPAYRNSGWGRFIPGVVLLLVGAAFLLGFSEGWPLILVGVGVAMLIGMLFRKR